MLLIAGLGNPGRRYAGNRHNIGFMAADEIHRRHRLSPWRARFEGETSEGTLDGEKVIVLKPATYMNESGRAVAQAMRFYKLAPADIVVIYDELDLPPGKMRMKTGGSAAGHNGLRSIEAHVGKDFRRMRIGIGHPGAKELVNGYVLHDFAKADREWIEPLLAAIADNAPLLAARQRRELHEPRPPRHCDADEDRCRPARREARGRHDPKSDAASAAPEKAHRRRLRRPEEALRPRADSMASAARAACPRIPSLTLRESDTMGFRCGIVGLPNVGKSTLFNALTRTAAAQAANYPFCTIEPNTGEVAVPDPRLDKLADARQVGGDHPDPHHLRRHRRAGARRLQGRRPRQPVPRQHPRGRRDRACAALLRGRGRRACRGHDRSGRRRRDGRDGADARRSRKPRAAHPAAAQEGDRRRTRRR